MSPTLKHRIIVVSLFALFVGGVYLLTYLGHIRTRDMWYIEPTQVFVGIGALGSAMRGLYLVTHDGF